MKHCQVKAECVYFLNLVFYKYTVHNFSIHPGLFVKTPSFIFIPYIFSFIPFQQDLEAFNQPSTVSSCTSAASGQLLQIMQTLEAFQSAIRSF